MYISILVMFYRSLTYLFWNVLFNMCGITAIQQSETFLLENNDCHTATHAFQATSAQMCEFFI